MESPFRIHRNEIEISAAQKAMNKSCQSIYAHFEDDKSNSCGYSREKRINFVNNKPISSSPGHLFTLKYVLIVNFYNSLNEFNASAHSK